MWRTAAEMSPPSNTLRARNANGNYSGANRIFDASRDWSAARVSIISSSALAFSHGPSFFHSATSSSLSLLQPRPSFLFVGLFHAPRGVFPFSPRSNFERLCVCGPVRKSRNTLSRDSCFMRSHGYGRSKLAESGSRLQW